MKFVCNVCEQTILTSRRPTPVACLECEQERPDKVRIKQLESALADERAAKSALESEKAALERRLKETENYAKTFHSNSVESWSKLKIAVEELKRLSENTFLEDWVKYGINEALARIEGKE